MSEEITSWKLVPSELTITMLEAAQCHMDRGMSYHYLNAAYKAILSVAPETSANPAFWIDPSSLPMTHGAEHIYVTDISTDGCTQPVYLEPQEPSASVGMEPVADFGREKLVIEYCSQYGISDDDPRKADIVNAFCVGTNIQREQLAALQAKLEQAEKDKARLIEVLKLAKQFREHTGFIDTAIAKYEEKKS